MPRQAPWRDAFGRQRRRCVQGRPRSQWTRRRVRPRRLGVGARGSDRAGSKGPPRCDRDWGAGAVCPPPRRVPSAGGCEMSTLAPGMTAASPLTGDQRQIVEWGDGPLVVIAGAGTGKTRVTVERVRYLLETKGDATVDENGDLRLPRVEPPGEDTNAPFSGPLLP